MYKPHAQTFCRATVRSINNWNNLPMSAVECASINLFENLVGEHCTNEQYICDRIWENRPFCHN